MLAVILLAIGLSMDAVALALVRGASGEHTAIRAAETGAAFGLAQGIMPIAGWSLAVVFNEWIAPFDHWIAFGVLAFLGIVMIREAVSADESEPAARARSHYTGLVMAALATSLDAGAAGLTLPLFDPPVLVSCLVIAAVTAGLCVPAYWLGTRASARYGSIAEIAGGLALIAIGAKILTDHLMA